MNIIKLILTGKPSILKYLTYSAVATVVDTMIVWLLIRFWSVPLITANTTGIVSGGILHYLLVSKSVFQTGYGAKGFLIYLSTFIFGLFIANCLIHVSYEYIFCDYMVDLRILLSKGVSLTIPFFILYFTRRYLFSLLNKGGQ